MDDPPRNEKPPIKIDVERMSSGGGSLAELRQFMRRVKCARLAIVCALFAFIYFSPNRVVALVVAAPFYLAMIVVANRLCAAKVARIHRKDPDLVEGMQIFAAAAAEESDVKEGASDAAGMVQSARLKRWIERLPHYVNTFDADAFRAQSALQGDDEYLDDTLYFDAGGHGVDMQDGIIEEGIAWSLDMIDSPPDESELPDRMDDLLLCIESVAACSGAPSKSRELASLRAWGETYRFVPPRDLVETMLQQVDGCILAYRETPEDYGLNPDHLDELLAAGAEMRDRIETLLMAGQSGQG